MPAWAFGTGINNARYFQHLGMIFCPIRKALRELFGKGQLKRRKILLLVINTMRCCSTFGTDKQSGVSAHWFLSGAPSCGIRDSHTICVIGSRCNRDPCACVSLKLRFASPAAAYLFFVFEWSRWARRIRLEPLPIHTGSHRLELIPRLEKISVMNSKPTATL